MVHFRRERLGEQLQAELSDVILRELRDPRIGFVTVTEVRMSADLKQARVYVSVFGSEEEKTEAFAGLERAAGFLKREIGSRLNLRYVPELKFVQDDTLERSARIEALLADSESDDDE